MSGVVGRHNRDNPIWMFLTNIEIMPSGCWHWLGAPRSKTIRYGRFFFLGKRYSAHRFMWELYYNAIVPIGLFVLHRCDNPPCVNPEHLFLGTAKANAEDRQAKGRGNAVRGQEHYNYRVTPQLEIEIREARVSGLKYRELVTRFSLCQEMICRVLRKFDLVKERAYG